MNTFRDQDGQVFDVNPLKLVCDFCSGEPVRWSYPARDFQRRMALDGSAVQANSHGAWAACDACHALIQASDREALHERSAASFPVPVDQIPPHVWKQITAEIRALQDTFWSVRDGAPAPFAVEGA